MSRNRSRSFPCVLKTIINDAHKDNKSFTLNDKQIRSRLRAKINTHMKNTSWVANNQREYDAIRCAFDASYASRMTRKPRTRKSTSNATNVETSNETTNA
jgi:hypothetical protein